MSQPRPNVRHEDNGSSGRYSVALPGIQGEAVRLAHRGHAGDLDDAVVARAKAYAAARGLPQRPEDLANCPVISAAVIGRPLRLSAYYGGLPRQHVVLEPTVVSRNYVFLRDAIRAGLGVGIVPDYVVHRDLAAGELLPALTPWRLSIFGRAMYMLYMPNRHHPRAISMMIEFILARAQASHEGMPGLLAPAG